MLFRSRMVYRTRFSDDFSQLITRRTPPRLPCQRPQFASVCPKYRTLMRHVLHLLFIQPRGRTHHSDLACSLLNIIFGRRLTACRFRINLPNPLPFPGGWKEWKVKNQNNISIRDFIKRSSENTAYIFTEQRLYREIRTC